MAWGIAWQRSVTDEMFGERQSPLANAIAATRRYSSADTIVVCPGGIFAIGGATPEAKPPAQLLKQRLAQNHCGGR